MRTNKRDNDVKGIQDGRLRNSSGRIVDAGVTRFHGENAVAQLKHYRVRADSHHIAGFHGKDTVAQLKLGNRSSDRLFDQEVSTEKIPWPIWSDDCIQESQNLFMGFHGENAVAQLKRASDRDAQRERR